MKKNNLMKKIFVIVAFVFGFVYLSAQSNMSVTIGGGGAFPLSELASTEYDIEHSGGFAKPGYFYSAAVFVHYNPKIAFGIRNDRFYLTVDTKKWEEAAFEPGIDSIVKISSNSWYSKHIYGGFSYRFSINKRLFVTAKLYLGSAKVIAPEVTIDAVSLKGDVLKFQRKESADNCFAVSTDIGIEYILNKNFSITTSINYHNFKPNFEFTNNLSSTELRSGYLNLSCGINFYFRELLDE